MSRVTVIVNPRAGRGRVGRRIGGIASRLRDEGHAITIQQTAYRGHAIELARAAATDGSQSIIAVGGDGTVNEVVNGMIEDDRPIGQARLGVIAAGSGADFARTFGLPADLDGTDGPLLGPDAPIDVGRITCRDGGGAPIVRYFVNAAEAGMAAATVVRAERLPRFVGRTRYLIAFWPTLARFRPVPARIAAGADDFEGITHNVVIANGRYLGGGMQISPHSHPSDGKADLQVSIGPKRQAFTLIPRIYKGTHLPDERIVQMTASSGSVITERPVPVETDGEPIGQTPLEFEMLPSLLRMHGAAS